MQKTILANTVRNITLCLSVGGTLIACGGSASSNSSSSLLADGEACAAAWSSGTAYNGGVKVSRSGRNYTSAFWTQGNDPATSSGAAGSGQPWITGYLCGGATPTPTPTPAPTPTPTPAPTPTPTPAPTPTPTPAGCTYQTWSSGVNYAKGTIVKYPANGQFYKEVNAGTNGSDGTDPTISTWYWQPTTCSGATPTPTPAPTPTPTPTGGFTALSQTQFNAWFPNRNPFYQYADFVAATAYYPSFAKSGNATLDKQEVAAFFANLQHESDQLKAVREYNTANYGSYCDVNWVQVACKSTNWNDQYFGRGPIQISWTSNYRALGNALGLGEQLVTNPEMLATNATIAWRSALWYWMTQNGRAAQPAHAAMVNGIGFGQTINAINGFRECVGGSAYQGPAQMQTRVNFYTTFTQNLGVPTGPNTTC